MCLSRPQFLLAATSRLLTPGASSNGENPWFFHLKMGPQKDRSERHPGMLRMNVDEFRWYIILLYLTGIFSRCQAVKVFTFSLLSFLSSQHSQWKTSVNGAYSIAMNREYRFCSPVPVWFPLCSKHVTHQPDSIWQRSRPRSQCIRSSTIAGTSWNQMWS